MKRIKRIAPILLMLLLAFLCSGVVSAKAKTPAKPASIEFREAGIKSVSFKWSSVRGASGYAIFQYNAANATYKQIATTKQTSYTVTGLEPDLTATFRVKSFVKSGGQVVYSKFSDAVSGVPYSKDAVTGSSSNKKTVNLNSTKDVHGTYYKATVKRDIKAQNLTTGKTITLKKGTQIVAFSRTNQPTLGAYKKNQKIKVQGSALTYTDFYYNNKIDYTTAAKESYVNRKGYSSKTNYLIWVNFYTCKVSLFKGSARNWKLVNTWPCVVGRFETPSVKGLYRVQLKTTSYATYGGYGLRFHYSTKYQKGNWIHRRLGSPMGYPASHGCIRMNPESLKVVYDSCPVDTTVLNY
ncbi:MAG: L,D-transpeptidase family protein [Eubacteriales bacterium]|nr:L,D-transpeptidase family protein [Eubacteriales bacterium]